MRSNIDPETGIEVHLYGSHIFHTSDPSVWSFIRRFTEFTDYKHKVLAFFNGKFYHLPIGRTLVREYFGVDIPPSQLDDERKTALFNTFVRGYTSKQWGVPPECVDPVVIARLKVRNNSSTDYFDDTHQGIPADGYNAIFDRMLDHPNIVVECNHAFSLRSSEFANSAIPVYYSGPIDALFNHKFGSLPWRTLVFRTERLATGDFQGNAVVNYPDPSVPFTRIHEFRHFRPDRLSPCNATIVMREYPKAWEPGNIPYYPIESEKSRQLLKCYRNELSLRPNITVGGRLGAYRYYDMDQSIAAALAVNLRE